jgi:hypothetical protein
LADSFWLRRIGTSQSGSSLRRGENGKVDKATKADHGGERNPEGKNQHSEGDKFDNIKLDQNEGEEKNASTGTSKSYTLQRLERDASDERH